MATRTLTAILVTLLMIGTTSCECLDSDEEQAVYLYTVRAYYLDGGSRVITMKGFYPPEVECYRGNYWLASYHGLCGRERVLEPAACRYDLLETKDISEEYYGKKIVSSRSFRETIIHKLAEKGGTK